MRVCYGAQPRLLGTGLNPNDINEEGRKKQNELSWKQWMKQNIWERRE